MTSKFIQRLKSDSIIISQSYKSPHPFCFIRPINKHEMSDLPKISFMRKRTSIYEADLPLLKIKRKKIAWLQLLLHFINFLIQMCGSELDGYMAQKASSASQWPWFINPHSTLKLLLRVGWSAQFPVHFSRTAGINNLWLFFFSSRITSVIIVAYCGLWNMYFYSEL